VSKSALRIQEGVFQPPCINPEVFSDRGKRKRRKYSVDEFVSGILSGDRTILGQAITLVESSLPQHYDTSQAIIERCLPSSGNSVRVGITGVPEAH
jgi:LAO/AO transport system kinase